MRFKEYFEATATGEKLFLQRDITQKKDVGKLLGFINPLTKFSQGSIATIYEHPSSDDKLIKVTSHKEDIENLVKAQGIKSFNVVKLFPWRGGKLVKDLPSLDSYAVVVEKIVGQSMAYTTNDFYELSLGGKFELAADWLDAAEIHKKQKNILEFYKKNNPEEHIKLSSLFRTLYKLEKFYRIEMSDFQDNILDDGIRYVVVDMGF